MFHFRKLLVGLALVSSSAFALEQADRSAIQNIIGGYTEAWNLHEGKGFGEGFSENADFVNIFGMKLHGKEEIESRHIQILGTIYKNSVLEIKDTKLREVHPGLVIATIDWKLKGFHAPGSDLSAPGETRDGVFTQVFVLNNQKWEITASQNTMAPKK